ncbi:MAG: hypothetical protein GY929_01785 [Actinomycetia bacterium]|nr:hypothetical protein [Actinomycetes bacterium]
MPPTEECTSIESARPKSSGEVFIEELIVDALITTAIVWGLVLLGEPLLHVLMSPVLIILTLAGVAHLTFKALRHHEQNAT